MPYTGKNSPNSFPRNPHLLDFFLIASKYKWILAILFVAGVFVGIYLPFVMPNDFETQSLLLPPDRSSAADLLTNYKASGALKMLKAVENPSVDLLQNILESRSILTKVASDSIIENYYVRYVSKSDYPTKTDWMADVIHVEPGFTKVVVVGDVWTRWQPTSEEIEAARVVGARAVNLAVKDLESFISTELKTGAQVARIQAEAELANRTHDLDSLSDQISTFESVHEAVALPQQISLTIRNQAMLRAQAMDYEMARQTTSLEYAAESPEMLDVRSKLASVQTELTKVESINQNSIQSLPEVVKQYAALQLASKQTEAIVTFLRQEVEQERVNEHRDRTVVQLLDSALPAGKRKSPKRLPMLLLSLTASVALGIFYVCIRELMANFKNSYLVDLQLTEVEAA